VKQDGRVAGSMPR